MNAKYPELEGGIAVRGIRKSVVASAIGISGRTLYNKLHGKTPFSWPEVEIIQRRFFPDVEKDVLFSSHEQNPPSA